MEMSNSESFIEPPTSPSSPDEIDSLPSSATSSSADDDEYLSDADREWKESLQQLELLLTMVMVPYLGKYFGRKFAYWGTSCSRCKVRVKDGILTILQDGPSSWSGNTPSKSSSRIQELSKQPVLSRRQRHYNLEHFHRTICTFEHWRCGVRESLGHGYYRASKTSVYTSLHYGITAAANSKVRFEEDPKFTIPFAKERLRPSIALTLDTRRQPDDGE
jgi:hypothetical protein